MQLIAVDIGNSSTKIAVDHVGADDRWSQTYVLRGDATLSADALTLGGEPCFWAISSVNQVRLGHLEKWVRSNRAADVLHVISPEDVALETDVESREKLGRDRLVAAWMAVELDEGAGPLIVVDAGTAVTIDYVDADEVFQGGVIYPGAESNFRQLAQHTNALPDLSREAWAEHSYHNCIGKSTVDAIRKGVMQSQAGAIREIVKQMLALSPHEQSSVYLTGGGITGLVELLPDEWNEVPVLVLRGAKKIGANLIGQSK